MRTSTVIKNDREIKSPSRITATAKAAGVKPAAARSEEQSTIDKLMQNYLNAQAALLKAMKAPTWKRLLAGAVVALLVAVGVGWLAGFAIDFFALGVMSLTGSAYAGLVIWFLGICIMFVGAGKLSAMAWDAVVSGRVEEFVGPKLTATKNWIAGKFAFGERDVAAA